MTMSKNRSIWSKSTHIISLSAFLAALLTSSPLQAADVSSWGSNPSGQLGTGNLQSSAVPVDVLKTGALSGKRVIQVAAGGQHSLALTSEGKVYSWGNNNGGQLGNNSTASSSVPVAVYENSGLADKTVIAIAAGSVHSLALTSEGAVFAWGSNSFGQLGVDFGTTWTIPTQIAQTAAVGNRRFVSIAAGGFHSIALANDGQLIAWGDNTFGQIGNGANEERRGATNVNMSGALSGKSIMAIAAGLYHSLALSSDGLVFSWGRNAAGQLGDGSNSDRNVPVPVSAANRVISRGVIAIAAGSNHSVALLQNRMVATWGGNTSGQLGDGTTTNSNVPVRVATGVLPSGKVSRISAGLEHNVAYAMDGNIYAWGANFDGQLGSGNINASAVPVKVVMTGALAGKVVFEVSAGGNHSLAVAEIPVASTAPAQLVKSDTATVGSGVGQNYEIHLDMAEEAVFYSSSSSPARFSGLSAAGDVLDPANTHPGIKYETGQENGNYWYRYTVFKPSSGIWQYGTTAGNDEPSSSITQSLTVSNYLRLEGESSQANYPVGSAPIIRATITENGIPKPGVTVSARFGDNFTEQVFLYDDGTHNDGAAGDGVYGAAVPALSTKGNYTATIRANGNSAKGLAFQRQTSVVFTVGADVTPPDVAVTSPAHGSTRR